MSNTNALSAEELLASLLVRLLGAYFAVFAIIQLVPVVAIVISSRNTLDPDRLLLFQAVASVAGPAVQLAIGVYLSLRGQWAFNRLLTPIRPRSSIE
ncbi:MAG: hypothetical protein ABFC63_03500 [Thermoguttaceae bacterium]